MSLHAGDVSTRFAVAARGAMERSEIERRLRKIEAYRRRGVATYQDLAEERRLQRRLVDLDFEGDRLTQLFEAFHEPG
jgi:hypothetical protein